jgi:hypothetical protein
MSLITSSILVKHISDLTIKWPQTNVEYLYYWNEQAEQTYSMWQHEQDYEYWVIQAENEYDTWQND